MSEIKVSRLLATEGFSETEMKALKAILTLSESGLNGAWYFSDTPETADVVMVSLETDQGRSWWNDHDTQTASPDLIACSLENQVGVERQLRMGGKLPPSRNALIQLLNQFSSQAPRKVASPPQGAPLPQLPRNDGALESMLGAPPMPNVESVDFDDVFYPYRYLTGLLNSAVVQGDTCCFESGEHLVMISVEQERYYLKGSLETLIPLCRIEADKIHRWSLPAADLAEETRRRELSDHPLDELRWFAALVAAAGRLWSGCSVTDVIKLKTWPPVSHLPQFRKYLPLAAFMLRNSTDLNEICAEIGMEMSDAIDFHNACHALDLVERHGERHFGKKTLSDSMRDIYRKISDRIST